MSGSEYLLWSYGQFEKMTFFPPDPLIIQETHHLHQDMTLTRILIHKRRRINSCSHPDEQQPQRQRGWRHSVCCNPSDRIVLRFYEHLRTSTVDAPKKLGLVPKNCVRSTQKFVSGHTKNRVLHLAYHKSQICDCYTQTQMWERTIIDGWSAIKGATSFSSQENGQFLEGLKFFRLTGKYETRLV